MPMDGIVYRGRLSREAQDAVRRIVFAMPKPLADYLQSKQISWRITYSKGEDEISVEIKVSKPLDPRALKAARKSGLYIEAPFFPTALSYLPWWTGDTEAVKNRTAKA